MGPPEGKAARSVTNEALRVEVNADVTRYLTRLDTRSEELMIRGQHMNLSGDALADFIDEGTQDIPRASIDRAARGTTTKAHNWGRNLEVQRRLDDLSGGTAVRTEILDESTCENCIKLDETAVEINGPVISISPEGEALLREHNIDPYGPDAYFAILAPNFCLGEDQCRGLVYYRLRAAA